MFCVLQFLQESVRKNALVALYNHLSLQQQTNVFAKVQPIAAGAWLGTNAH